MRSRTFLWILFALVGGIFLFNRAWENPATVAIPIQPAPAEIHAELAQAPAPRTPRPRPAKPAPKRTSPQTSSSVVPPEHRVTALKKALAEDPNNARLLAELAATLSKGLQSPAEAIPYFEQSLKLDSSNGTVFYDLVGAYLDSGTTDRGVSFLEELVRTNPPNSASAYAALADLKATTGDPIGAAEAAQAAAEIDPGSPVIQSLRGSIYLQSGDVRALETLQKADQNQTAEIKRFQETGQPIEASLRHQNEIRESLFEAYIQDGQFAEARKILSTFKDDYEHKSRMEARAREAERSGIN